MQAKLAQMCMCTKSSTHLHTSTFPTNQAQSQPAAATQLQSQVLQQVGPGTHACK